MKLSFLLLTAFAFTSITALTSCGRYPDIVLEQSIAADNTVIRNLISIISKADDKLKVKTVTGDNISESDISVLIEERLSSSAGADRNSSYNTIKAVIGRKIYAPVTFFYDPALSASAAEIADGKFRIKLLDEISLPEKALAVDGKYPGDSDYPLSAEITAIFPDYTRAGSREREKAKIVSKILSALAENSQKQNLTDLKKLTWISFAGDIMPGRGVERILSDNSGFSAAAGLEKVFGGTLEILQRSSLAVGNLEGAVTEQTGRVDKSYNFKFPFQVLARLKDAGFDYLMITNNHSFDYGEKGFKDTLENLDKAGIATSGAAPDIREALKPWSTVIDGTGINIFSLADYPAEKLFTGRTETEAGENRMGIVWPSAEFLESLKSFSGDDSIDIVCVHGGFEWVSGPAAGQKSLYRQFAENGADLVIGTHPHVLQPLEVSTSGSGFPAAERKSLIAYSIGNFIFPGMENTLYGEETILLETGFAGKDIKYINIHPVRISGRTIDIDKSGAISDRFFKMNREWNR